MKQKKRSRFPVWIEIIVAILLVISAAVIRFFLLYRDGNEIAGGLSFYELAQVGGESLPQITWQNISVSGIYTRLLHTVLSFLGNNQEAALWFQNAMFLLWMVLFYLVIRILAGRVFAILFLAVTSLLPVLIFGESHIRVLTPGVLVWTALGALLLVLAVIWKMIYSKVKKRREHREIKNEEHQAGDDFRAVPLEKPRKRTDPIPNPLAGPRKHVRRELDFEIELHDGQMDFDHEVTCNDDFDL